jgi:hypothetical protein
MECLNQLKLLILIPALNIFDVGEAHGRELLHHVLNNSVFRLCKVNSL